MALKLLPLTPQLVEQITAEALGLLAYPGVRVHNTEALTLLADAGAQVNFSTQVVSIPENVVQSALTMPYGFSLYSLDGKPTVHYGGDQVQFAPAMGAVSLLASEKGERRQPVTRDLVRFVKLVEVLPSYDAQSTAFVCHDVPDSISDLYRLYVTLQFTRKPVITSSFTREGWRVMWEMLMAIAGGASELAGRPCAIFETSPSPPLLWGDAACQQLLDCARRGLPIQLMPTPLGGITSPVTLAALVVQQTAENLSGLVLTQLAHPGSPVVWGGAPAVADMHTSAIALGDVGAWLVNSASAQVGRSLGLPTQACMGTSDAKVLDYQAGMEAMGSTLLAALSGINLVSGGGMIDFLRCQSFEKLVLDAEVIGMARRLIDGIEAREDPIALNLMRAAAHRSDFYSNPHTLKWFKQELYIPSDVIDRTSFETWKQKGSPGLFQRAAERIDSLLKSYRASPLPEELSAELKQMVQSVAKKTGMKKLPLMTEK